MPRRIKPPEIERLAPKGIVFNRRVSPELYAAINRLGDEQGVNGQHLFSELLLGTGQLNKRLVALYLEETANSSEQPLPA